MLARIVRQNCRVSVLAVAHWVLVRVEALLERRSFEASVVLLDVLRTDSGPVNNRLDQAFSVHLAVRFHSTVALRHAACVVWRGGLAVNHRTVVLSDDSTQIWHATITNFQFVGIEDLVQLGNLREVLNHKGAKSSADVRWNILAEWWVKPNNLSPACSPVRSALLLPAFKILRFRAKSTLSKCLVTQRLGICKDILIAGPPNPQLDFTGLVGLKSWLRHRGPSILCSLLLCYVLLFIPVFLSRKKRTKMKKRKKEIENGDHKPPTRKVFFFKIFDGLEPSGT